MSPQTYAVTDGKTNERERERDRQTKLPHTMKHSDREWQNNKHIYDDHLRECEVG